MTTIDNERIRSCSERVLPLFEWISSVPRGSYQDEKICDAVRAWADEQGYTNQTDTYGNIVIRKPASPGAEDAPMLALQGHLDMVCLADEGVSHDFSSEGIHIVRERDVIHAAGTTLGADDGAGVALCLAILQDDNIAHPALEVVLTRDEEVGLVGAKNADAQLVHARRMINLDSTREGVFIVGSCGGRHAQITLPVERTEGRVISASSTNPPSLCAISLEGLRGGHAGMDIDKGRLNAGQLLAQTLVLLADQLDCRLIDFSAGEKLNAIPSSAVMEIALSKSALDKLPEALEQARNAVVAACEGTDEDPSAVRLTCSEVRSVCDDRIDADAQDVLHALNAASTRRVGLLLEALPHGAFEHSEAFDGAVTLSDNIGLIRLGDGVSGDEGVDNALHVEISIRTNEDVTCDNVVDKIERVASELGAVVQMTPEGNPWAVDADSKLLALAQDVFVRTYGHAPELAITHGGLECGVFAQKLSGLDVFSMGPDMIDIHTPREHTTVQTLGRTLAFLEDLVQECAK